MPKVEDTPAVLRQLHFFGLDVDIKGGPEAQGECPFCGKPKFSVNVETTKWQCFGGSCQKRGNWTTFLPELWELSRTATKEDEYKELAESKGLLFGATVREWGLCKSALSGEWLIPGWSVDGRLVTLYRVVKIKGRGVFVPPPECGHGLLGVPLLSGKEDTLFLCEGYGDGMALWEVLSRARRDDEGLKMTANRSVSMLSFCGVVAAPGATVWLENWPQLFAGKTVVLCYDNDHPKKDARTGAVKEPAGLMGARRATASLLMSKSPPKEVRYFQWGDEGYSRQWPDGYDARDWFTGKGLTSTRSNARAVK